MVVPGAHRPRGGGAAGPIRPCLEGLCDPPPLCISITMQNIATKNYIQKKIVFFLGLYLRDNTILYRGAPQVSFFAYFIGGPLRSVSSLTIVGPLSSVSSHTIWGPPQINFFAYYMGAP